MTTLPNGAAVALRQAELRAMQFEQAMHTERNECERLRKAMERAVETLRSGRSGAAIEVLKLALKR
jgi:hypothetical protein